MADGKLYYGDGAARGVTAHVIAKYEGLDVERIQVYPRQRDTKPLPEGWAESFPYLKVPAFEKGDFKLFETLAVSQYFSSLNDKASLYGKTKEERALVQQWFSFSTTEFHVQLSNWYGALIGIHPYNRPVVQIAEQNTHSILQIYENHLKTRTFLVGERITAADISTASTAIRGSELVLDKEVREKYPNFWRFVRTVVNQPPFLSVIASPVFVEKAIQYTPPKKEAAPKKDKPAAAEQPKKEKAAKKKDDDEEEEDDKPAEPKAKHPCEALGAPKSFPLDEWKRTYSNNETKDAMAWLAEHYKGEDYTFWKATYKYPEELTQVFMSSNLIGGFHNRLEGSRKYLFGSSGVYGTNNNSKIQGVYLIRGNDFKAVFDVAPDYESYEFVQLDFEKDKEFIHGCWAWTNEYDGFAYADGKVFK